jgi:hypothetical protein
VADDSIPDSEKRGYKRKYQKAELGDWRQVVEYLHSKHEALSSTPVPPKQNRTGAIKSRGINSPEDPDHCF